MNLLNPFFGFGGVLGNTTAGVTASVAFDSYNATLWDSSYRVNLSGVEELRGHGSPQQQLAPTPPCALCQKNYHAPDGKGPASSIPGVPAADTRRIITVAIDSSWDTSPGSGTTHNRIWNATACAVQMWNVATDGAGNKTGFYIVMDQLHQRGEPDVIIKKGVCSQAQGGGGWACSAFPFDDASFQTEMTLADKNVTTAGITDDMLCGRVAHELSHKLGGHATGTCYTQSTILYGTNTATGKRLHNRVMPVDVEVVNQALNQPASCTGVGPVTEPAEEIASRADEPAIFLNGAPMMPSTNRSVV
ncbi:MAG TPA: hypothetical protein VJ755_11825, partial [Gemmatimonadales bacterium]|nr:hypothetical protein [Gemmatimonadales bacterium]